MVTKRIHIAYENSISERLAENESLEDKTHPEYVLSVTETEE